MLPYDQQLDINSLSKLFDKTKNSYKFIFFLAILEHVKKSGLNTPIKVDVSQLIENMLCLSAYPIKYFNLNFGSQDQMAFHLASLGIAELNELTHKAAATLPHKIHHSFQNSSAKELEKYVPYRLLQPFFSNELKGLKDVEKNDKTFDLANEFFDERKPLYKLEKCSQKLFIIFHPLWLKYLSQNYLIIKAWAEFAWASYLQSKNPNSPNIINKIAPPLARAQLTTQRRVWDEFLQSYKVTCIYTDEPIHPSTYELDHFIPWSYLGHDQHWNLIPASAVANGQKSNSLPHADYFDKFCVIQNRYFNFLQTHNKRIPCEDYVVGLNTSLHDLASPQTFNHKLNTTLVNLNSMAQLQGFSPDWKFV